MSPSPIIIDDATFHVKIESAQNEDTQILIIRYFDYEKHEKVINWCYIGIWILRKI